MDDKNEAPRPTATAPVEAGEVKPVELTTLEEEVATAVYDYQTSVGLDIEAAGEDAYGIMRSVTPIISAAITAAEARGAESERGKVVAWLRFDLDDWDDYVAPADIADAIETGAHDG